MQASRQLWMIPTAQAAVDVRPDSSDVWAILKPSPGLPSRRSSATCTPSKKSAAVLEAWRPSLSGIACRSSPGASPSTTKAAIPLARFAASVWAKTTMVSAWQPLEIQNLLPESTQPPSLRTAESSMPAGSEPALGSDRAKAPIFLAAKRSGSQRARCSSVPKTLIAVLTSESCTVSAAVKTEGLAPPIASQRRT